MSTLSARYIRQPRGDYYCEWCRRRIYGEHIYLYGSAEPYEKPWPMRLHLTGNCRPHDMKDQKIAAALRKADGDLDDFDRASPDAQDRYLLQHG